MCDPMAMRPIQRKKLAEHPRGHGMRGNDSILEVRRNGKRRRLMVIYFVICYYHRKQYKRFNQFNTGTKNDIIRMRGRFPILLLVMNSK